MCKYGFVYIGLKMSTNTGTGLDSNVAGALAYILGLITGVVFFIIEEDDDFVRFHAAQSIVYSVAVIIVYIVLSVLQSILFAALLTGGLGLFGLISIIWTIVWILSIILWLLLMYKAYQGEKYKLPIIGNIAENLAT